MSSTDERRAVIKELVLNESISSQEELGSRLKKRGFAASQPALSRDLRALKVAKQDGVYRVTEDLNVTPLTALKSLLRGVEPVSHLVMVHCEPGAASAVARALEAEEIHGLVGSVAGDDTVLVGVASEAAERRVKRCVADLLV